MTKTLIATALTALLIASAASGPVEAKNPWKHYYKEQEKEAKAYHKFRSKQAKEWEKYERIQGRDRDRYERRTYRYGW
jgi:hypothetical protein